MKVIIVTVVLVISSLVGLHIYNNSNDYYSDGRRPAAIEPEETTGLWFSKETKDSMTDEKTLWITRESSGSSGSDNRYHTATLNVICSSNGGEGVFLSSQDDFYTSPQDYPVTYRFDEQSAAYESWSAENKNTWPRDTQYFISQIQDSKTLQVEVETLSTKIRYKFDLAGFKKAKKGLDNKCRQLLARQN